MSSTRRPRTLLAATGLALTLALVGAACTDDDGGTIVAGSGADSGAEGAIPIRVAGSPGAGGGPAASTEMAADADTRMTAPYVITDYVLGGDLPDLGTEAMGWRFDAGAPLDDAALRRAADALGVSGDMVEVPTDMGGGWRIGPDDGTAPAIWVTADGARSWWYSPAWATAEYSVGTVGTGVACAEPGPIEPVPLPVEEPDAPTDATDVEVAPDETDVAIDPLAVGTGDCVFAEPEPPAGVPSADDAEARARELFSAMGLDPAGLELETYADDWSASVTGYPLLDGLRSPMPWSIGFGAEGRVEWAGGSLATPIEVGPYPLIPATEAFARLQAGYGAWGDPRMLATDVGAQPAETPDAEVAVGAPVDAEPGVATDAMTVDPAACAADGPGCFTPEPITVTIVGAELSLWSLYDIDGTMWFVPAYTFLDDNGGQYPVPAVTDEYLLVDDTVADDTVVEPPADPTQPGDGEPGVVPGDEGTGEAPPTDPTAPTTSFPESEQITEEQAATLLGLTEEEATRTAEANGWTVRVVARDGEAFAVTMDFSPTRVNLTVDAGLVTDATVG